MTVYPSRKDHKRPTISHADNLRAMTDEELAEWIASIYPDCPPNRIDCKNNTDNTTARVCKDCWLEWLKQEAEG